MTKAKLQEINIVNPHDIASRASRLFIGYETQQLGRAYRPASWKVIHCDKKTDPKGAWYDYGHKTFNVYRREEKPVKLQEAIEWATKMFGVKEWERGPFGDYHPKGDVAKAIESATKQLAEKT